MKLALYEEICSKLLLIKDDVTPPPSILQTQYPHVKPSTIQGIYHRLVQSLGRRRIWKFESLKLSPKVLLERFISRWEQNPTATDIIVKMSWELCDVPPCFLARLLVKAYIESLSNHQTEIEYKSTTIDMEDLTVTPPIEEEKTFYYSQKYNHEFSRTRLSSAKLYRNPSLILHSGMSRNVDYCHAVDKHYSPAMDEFRNRIGREYEEKLVNYLNKLGVAHLDEPAMRRMGYARTPDTVLLEPLAINGLIVKWIESKAWFADPPSHATYLRDQYWPYYNRFGPGLVIYWFGYVDESIESHCTKGVAVLDDFPDFRSITSLVSPLADIVLSAKPNSIDESIETDEPSSSHFRR